jgi:hypothetical protein
MLKDIKVKNLTPKSAKEKYEGHKGRLIGNQSLRDTLCLLHIIRGVISCPKTPLTSPGFRGS